MSRAIGQGMKRPVLLGLCILVVVVVGGFALLGWWSQAGGQRAPGLRDGRLVPCGTAPNCVCSESGGDAEHAVAPLAAGVLDWPAVAAAVRAVGGGESTVEGDYLHAKFTSRVFRFADDLELRRDGEHLQVRAASRVGYSDLGANRQRVEALRRALATASTRQ